MQRSMHGRDVSANKAMMGMHLLFLFLVPALLLLCSSSGTLALYTTGTAAAVRRGQRKVDVFLRIEANDE
jgi:hypothetical protein